MTASGVLAGLRGSRIGDAVRRHASALFLAALIVALTGASYAGLYEQNARSQRQFAQVQARQRQAGLLIEKSLCADLATMAAIPAPAGNPARNPSRAYEQAEARAWAGLVRDLGCAALTGRHS